jgi:hypothetical protein
MVKYKKNKYLIIISVIIFIVLLFILANRYSVANTFLNTPNSYSNDYIPSLCSKQWYDSLDPPSWSPYGYPVALSVTNEWSPCGRFKCSGNDIVVEKDARVRATPDGTIYGDYIDGIRKNYIWADLPRAGLVKTCPNGCTTSGNTVSCIETPTTPTPTDNTSAIIFYQNYNKTFSTDFTSLPVKSCNDAANWQSLNCDFLYYCYAILPSRDVTDINQAIQKNCAEVSSNTPKVATIGVEPFTPPASASEWVITHFVILDNEQFKNGAWISNKTIPSEYIQAEDIFGNYVTPPGKLDSTSLFGAIGAFFANLWNIIKLILGI